MLKVIDDDATKLANEHIEWFLSTLRPLLFSHFIHGYKHGVEHMKECEDRPPIANPAEGEKECGCGMRAKLDQNNFCMICGRYRADPVHYL